MTDTTNEPINLILQLTLDQVQKVVAGLNELKNGTDTWPLKQYIIQQANEQLDLLNPNTEGSTENTNQTDSK